MCVGLGVAPAAVAALGDDYLASKRRGVVSRALMVRREDAEPLLSESPGIRLAGVRKDGDHVPARWWHVVAFGFSARLRSLEPSRIRTCPRRSEPTRTAGTVRRDRMDARGGVARRYDGSIRTERRL